MNKLAYSKIGKGSDVLKVTENVTVSSGLKYP